MNIAACRLRSTQRGSFTLDNSESSCIKEGDIQARKTSSHILSHQLPFFSTALLDESSPCLCSPAPAFSSRRFTSLSSLLASSAPSLMTPAALPPPDRLSPMTRADAAARASLPAVKLPKLQLDAISKSFESHFCSIPMTVK